MAAKIDMTGQRYGRLVALEYVGNQRWRCKCDCGNETVTRGSRLRAGDTRSCGCLVKDTRKTEQLLDKTKQAVTVHNLPPTCKSGVKGIAIINGKYRARVRKDNIQYGSPCFETLEQAVRWYENKCFELYGEDHITQEVDFG